MQSTIATVTQPALIARLRRAHSRLGETFRRSHHNQLASWHVTDDNLDEPAAHARHVGALAAHAVLS